jgi:hypothetical protein
MEGISAAVSVVAIVAIAGQSFKAVIKLIGSFQDAMNVSSDVATLISNLRSLTNGASIS